MLLTYVPLSTSKFEIIISQGSIPWRDDVTSCPVGPIGKASDYEFLLVVGLFAADVYVCFMLTFYSFVRGFVCGSIEFTV